MSELTILGIELLVRDIKIAVEFFERVLGFELVERRSTDDPAGEMAVFQVGDAALTVIEPSTHGPGTVIEDRTPRLGQIVLGAAPGRSAPVVDAVVTAGGTVHRLGDHRTVISPLVVAGATGVDAAITLIEAGDESG
ncbi:MAG: VOC family protein [Ilumatobacter sp.]|nr:VOC family protein [Ilumatobacter sp.]